MFAEDSDFLSQIKMILKSSFAESTLQNLDFPSLKKVIQNSQESISHGNLIQLTSELQKMGDCVRNLENQGEQLTCIVYYLFEKIANLAIKLEENNKTKNGKNQEQGLTCAVNTNGKDSSKREDKQRPELTKRESDVFSLLEKGLCAKEIAKILFISETTVITHKRNLKEKFNAKNSVELISKVLAK